MKKITFANRVVITLISILVVVIGSALFVNRSMQSIIQEIGEEVEPDKRLVLLKEVMFNISNAESNVKSYGLTQNGDYLENYNESITLVDSSIVLLYAVAENDAIFEKEIVRISDLLERKFATLDELLVVQNQQGVLGIMEKVEDKVDDINRRTVRKNVEQPIIEEPIVVVQEAEEIEEKKEEKFLKRLFGNRQKKKEEKTQKTETIEETTIQLEEIPTEEINHFERSFTEVSYEIDQIKTEESAYEQALKQQELKLIQTDKEIMDEISSIVQDLETSEQTRLQEQLDKAQKDKHFTAIVIGIFCFISCLLLIAAGYTIYTYVKQNNAYKKALRKSMHQTESKNKEILSSITYAERIQKAILPEAKKIETAFSSSFVLYQPKDIVAGDFYWMLQLDGYTFFAVADCTGHGVSGAMVSMSCSSALTRSVQEFKYRKPSEILDKCRALIIEMFDQGAATVYDGMDICLCRFEKSTNELVYAGANNALYIINDGELTEIKSDKQPVARYTKPFPFKDNVLKIKENDTFYLFTDGFADQFGGKKGKKLKYRNFQNLLLEKSTHEMADQKKHLLHALKEWRGDFDQIDDICVVGIRP